MARIVIHNHFHDTDDPCLEGYEQRGTKEKGGKTVPNCVAKSEDSSGYEAAKQAYRRAYEEQKAASAELRSFPRSSTGMHSDEVKSSASYRAAKTKWEKAQSAENSTMQTINRQFAKELKEARSKYGPNWYKVGTHLTSLTLTGSLTAIVEEVEDQSPDRGAVPSVGRMRGEG